MRIVVVGLVLLFAFVLVNAGTNLNQSAISANYRNGDFDAIEKEIQAFQSRNKTCSKADSFFVAKYLGVIYAANPATREKAKYYMHTMLNLNVGATLTDMFVSEEIQKIFDGVRSEFVAARQTSGRPLNKNELADFEGTNKPKPGNNETKNGAKIWWAVGGITTTAAVGITTYVLLSDIKARKPEKGFVVTIPGAGETP